MDISYSQQSSNIYDFTLSGCNLDHTTLDNMMEADTLMDDLAWVNMVRKDIYIYPNKD